MHIYVYVYIYIYIYVHILIGKGYHYVNEGTRNGTCARCVAIVCCGWTSGQARWCNYLAPSLAKSPTTIFHSIPFQLPYHPKVALAARLIIGLGSTNACALSICMYTGYSGVVHIPFSWSSSGRSCRSGSYWRSNACWGCCSRGWRCSRKLFESIWGFLLCFVTTASTETLNGTISSVTFTSSPPCPILFKREGTKQQLQNRTV